ncbi:unnamed protein product [Hyaloperonospora brassicae]|uniref:Tyrosine specific protein phosphatases domain-containing protein n=1 Tax=Hyaloperonospora brassicae TaxID=162125 RepID=A0AAV0V1U4_HYABA|nr:unnamed protein product [Hyaloperonospora brassicae]
MTSPSSRSLLHTATTCSVASLRSALTRDQQLGALPLVTAAIDAFLRKTRRLQCSDSHSSSSGFEREYRELCRCIRNAVDDDLLLTPQTRATKAKNRYKNILPFEKTRVKLQDTAEDYINANYIDGGYIACCAPVPAAISDFWHMVWQCDVHVVLMLTKFVEQARLSADVYWDTRVDHAVDFDGVYVKLVAERKLPSSQSIATRTFKVWKVDDAGRESESRVVQHFQLTSWPDHGVLQDYRVVALLLDSVNSYQREASQAHNVDAKVVVHCSAGVGRSGTFIAIDILLKQLHRVLTDTSDSDEEKARAMQHAMDVPRVVHRLRSQRPGMVQTPEQYRMIYQFLAAVVSVERPW